MDRLSRLIAVALLAASAACTSETDDRSPSAAARWLQGYLQVDTTNPPGNEDAAIDYLDALVAGTGIETRRLDAGDGRPSWLATLPANDGSSHGTLLLVHHVDVVPAGTGWRHPPFAGAVLDGALWGRGAIDAKGLGIAHVAALAALERSGLPRRRAVAVFATAAEETGGELGAGRWLRERPELFSKVDAVLNEGGTNRAFRGRLHWWGVETDQKRPLWLEVTAGDPEALVAALARLVDTPLEWRVTDTSRRIFRGLAPHYNDHWREVFHNLDRFVKPTGPTRALLPGMASYFLDSLQVNELERLADGSARASIDLRLLPETEPDAVLTTIRSVLGPAVSADVLLEATPAVASPFDHEVIDVIRTVGAVEGPVVEQMIGGVTDSRFFRHAGIPAYGFSPFLLDSEQTARVHAANEHMPLHVFDAGVERMRQIVEKWASRP